MTEVVGNGFSVQLAAPCSSSDTVIQVKTAAPAAVSGGQFRIEVGTEYMLVTSGGNTLNWNVTRGIEGTTPTSHSTNDSVFHYMTAGALVALLLQNRAGLAALGTDNAVGGPTGSPISSLLNGLASTAQDKQDLGWDTSNNAVWRHRDGWGLASHFRISTYPTDSTAAIETAAAQASSAGKKLIVDGHFLCSGAHLLGNGHHITVLLGALIESTGTNPVFWLGDGNHPFASGTGGANHTWTPLTGVWTRGGDHVQTSTPANAGLFAAGDFVWIRCREVISGGTNEPVAEIQKVASVDATTGIVKFAWPLAKDYADGADGTVYGISKIGTEVVQNVEIQGPGTLSSPSYRPIDGTALGYKLHGTLLKGCSGMCARGRFVERHHNRVEVTPNWASGYRPYLIESDTGSTDYKDHDNDCFSTGVGIVHIHEAQANINNHDNTYQCGRFDQTRTFGTGTLTPGSNVITGVTTPTGYVVGEILYADGGTAQTPPGAKISGINTSTGTITLVDLNSGAAANVTGTAAATTALYMSEAWSVGSIRAGSWNVRFNDNTIINSPNGDAIAVAASSQYASLGHNGVQVRNNTLSGRMVERGIVCSPPTDGSNQRASILNNTFLNAVANAGTDDITVSDGTALVKGNRVVGTSAVGSSTSLPIQEDPIYIQNEQMVGQASGANPAATLGAYASGRRNGWVFADAVTATAFFSFTVPSNWVRLSMDLLYTVLAGSGAVRWQMLFGAGFGDTSTIDVADTTINPTPTAAPAAGTLALANLINNSVLLPPGKRAYFRIQRLGGDAADTVAGSAMLHAVKFTPVTIAGIR